MTPIWKSIGGQNEAVLNLLNQFVGDSLGIKGFNVDIVFFGCHYKQLHKIKKQIQLKKIDSVKWWNLDLHYSDFLNS